MSIDKIALVTNHSGFGELQNPGLQLHSLVLEIIDLDEREVEMLGNVGKFSSVSVIYILPT